MAITSNIPLDSETPIEDCFAAYRNMIVSEKAGPEQLIETRRAFFSAAVAVVEMMLRAADDEGEGVGMSLLTNISKECAAFRLQIGDIEETKVMMKYLRSRK